MFYIYHIPERNKIGATDNVEVRMKKHQWKGFYEILETHTCEFKTSDREIELQKQYGYKVDKTPFWKSYRLGKSGKGGKTQGNRNVESGHLQSICKSGGLAVADSLGKRAVSTGQVYELNKRKRKLTYEQAEYIRAQYKRGKDVFGKPISQRRLARVFGVTRPVIGLILQNKTYTTP